MIEVRPENEFTGAKFRFTYYLQKVRQGLHFFCDDHKEKNGCKVKQICKQTLPLQFEGKKQNSVFQGKMNITLKK